MRQSTSLVIPIGLLTAIALSTTAHAQSEPSTKAGSTKTTPAFKWVNPLPANNTMPVRHATFDSKLVGQPVGYCIYLPPDYDAPQNANRRYPVVYYLHGGRPGSELKSIRMAPFFDQAIREGKADPMIYVFVNGGAMSHYNYPKLKSPGESVFIEELIPHIDSTYRTIASREGRGLEGFSQGGRGTARIMFKYPHLFCSAAPMGGGHQHEKRISESDGAESESIVFEPGNNTYDLARKFAANPQPPLRIFIAVGTEDQNYEPNLDWMNHLRSLNIPFEHRIVEGAPHSPIKVYEGIGAAGPVFHSDSFRRAARQQ